jgi:predicted peptidase
MRACLRLLLLPAAAVAQQEPLVPPDVGRRADAVDARAPRWDATATKPTTEAELPALLASLADGFHHKVELQTAQNRSIRFLLWLPRGFGVDRARGEQPWPTAFFLHGSSEGQAPGYAADYTTDTTADCPGVYPCTVGTEISKVARHGLPHAIEKNAPFGEQFVLVSPQRPLAPGQHDTFGRWSDHIETLEQLRMALFNSSSLFDRTRAYLTGLSSGGVGVWAWAAFNPRGNQPWAAIVPTSSAWPFLENDNDPAAERSMNASAIQRLLGMNIYVSHCVNDQTFDVDMGAQGRPPCVLQTLGRLSGLMCGFSADAIVETLRAANTSINLRYDRLENCRSPRMPTDTGPLSAEWYTSLQRGHDAWSSLYASADFVHWLLEQRLPAA